MPLTRTARTWVVGLATAAVVVAANASQGAYFSQSWGWVALAFLVPTTVVLILGAVRAPGRLRTAFAALTLALALWTALSASWSISSSASLREAERALVYVAVALAIAVLLRRGDAPAVLGGSLVGVTLVCSYSLSTRLFPDRVGTFDDPTTTYRLSEPLGYWNALGLLAVMGALLALGIAAHARRVPVAVCAGAALPILVSTQYFTFSRGAWGAAGAGYLALVALDPRRLRLLWVSLVVLPAAAVCVLLASHRDALTTEDSPLAAATREGHRQALVTVLLVACSGALAFGARAVSDRVPVARRGRHAFDLALAGLVAVAVVVAVVASGGPGEALSGLRSKFDAGPVVGADLNSRLFSISGNGRAETLRVAWDTAQAHLIRGQGAGSFEYVWYEHRPSQGVVRDAHSLYVETLSELGVVGLALLAGILAVVAVAALSARRARLVPAGFAAFVAWAVASSLDWHWEMVGVTMTALLAGAGGLCAAEQRRRASLGAVPRGLAVGLGVALSVAAVDSLVGNQALFAAREKVDRKEWAAAIRDARHAHRLLPWSFEPLVALGDAQAGAGNRAAALAAYRDAVAVDPENWTAWLRLAQVERGGERTRAYARVRSLNPLEQDLPGEGKGSG